MILALTDAAIVVGVMAIIGLLGYLMDRQGDRAGEEEKAAPIPDPDFQMHRKKPTSSRT